MDGKPPPPVTTATSRPSLRRWAAGTRRACPSSTQPLTASGRGATYGRSRCPARNAVARFPLVGSYNLRLPSMKRATKTRAEFDDPGQSFYIDADAPAGTFHAVVHDGPPAAPPPSPTAVVGGRKVKGSRRPAPSAATSTPWRPQAARAGGRGSGRAARRRGSRRAASARPSANPTAAEIEAAAAAAAAALVARASLLTAFCPPSRTRRSP